MASDLSLLSQIITSQVAEIDTVLAEKNLFFPSVNDPFNPATEAARMNPQVLKSIKLLVAAADHLINIVRPLPLLLTETAMGVSLF